LKTLAAQGCHLWQTNSARQASLPGADIHCPFTAKAGEQLFGVSNEHEAPQSTRNPTLSKRDNFESRLLIRLHH